MNEILMWIQVGGKMIQIAVATAEQIKTIADELGADPAAVDAALASIDADYQARIAAAKTAAGGA